MKLLIIDGYFMMHRARSGFGAGDYPVIFNFFRGLKAIIEKNAPCRAVVVIEGNPRQRLIDLPEYKATRVVDAEKEPEKHAELVKFHVQKDIIIKTLCAMPIHVYKHANFEADDIIAYLAKMFTKEPNTEVVIVSGDSDFNQLVIPNGKIKVFNPIKKAYVDFVPYDYVVWKALRGDATDNIPGLSGVGDVTARKLAEIPETIDKFLDDKGFREQFLRNLQLINFHKLSSEEENSIEILNGPVAWDKVENAFLSMGFQSFFKGTYWEKFKKVFDSAA